MLRAKVFAGIPARTDDGGASKRRFPVGGVILEQPLVCTGLWVKTLSSSGRATTPWRRDLLGGVVSRDPFWLVAFLGHCLGGNRKVGISAAWQGEWVLLRPRSGFRSFGGN